MTEEMHDTQAYIFQQTSTSGCNPNTPRESDEGMLVAPESGTTGYPTRDFEYENFNRICASFHTRAPIQSDNMDKLLKSRPDICPVDTVYQFDTGWKYIQGPSPLLLTPPVSFANPGVWFPPVVVPPGEDLVIHIEEQEFNLTQEGCVCQVVPISPEYASLESEQSTLSDEAEQVINRGKRWHRMHRSNPTDTIVIEDGPDYRFQYLEGES